MSRQLNYKQKDILQTVLRFRYVTTDNLANTRNITQNSAYSTLEILNKAGYLGKIHDKSYRLQNKSARYFLTTQAVDYLRYEAGIEQPESIWKSRKRDSSRSQDFINQQVAIHGAYNKLNRQLGKGDTIKTASELYGIEGIIKPMPSLMIEKKSGKLYFVELADGQHLFLAKKRIRKYIENYDAEACGWEQYPDVYFVRTNSSADCTRLLKYIEQKMDDAYLDEEDFSFYVVSSVKRINVS